ncbi:extracellular solute-binding protein [Rhodococcus koreensis]|uniref:extracellular solute-binding protein n=1 Tax=Rhodococcus sp. T2V TaxID=3034164 RepID=UPI0023E2160E|nr:extracellular solute-binding protein [Rhodococcus sp. T2V]
MNARCFNLAAIAALLALTSSACGSSSTTTNSDAMTFAGFGGALQASQTEAWFEPFAAANGIKVDQTQNSGVAPLQTQIQSRNVQWDVVEDAAFQANSGCGTLYEEIPDVDRSQIDPKFLTNDCGVPIVEFSWVLAYNSKKYPTPPTSVGDLINTKDFPGKRGISSSAVDGPLEAALLGDGVSADKLYPLDYERAISTLDTVKNDLVPKDSYAELQDGLVSGNLDMALIPNGRAFDASKVNPDIKVVWKDAITFYDNALVVKGAPNAEAAKSFLAYVAKPETQAALSQLLPYGVLTSGAPPQVPSEMEPFYPDSPSHASELVYQDSTWWSENQDAATAAWTNFISG